MKALLLSAFGFLYIAANAMGEVGSSSREIVENKTLLFGDWYSEEKTLVLTFDSDGKFTLNSKGLPPLHGTWFFLSRIFMMSFSGQEQPEECAIQGTVSNDQLDSFDLIKGEQRISYKRVLQYPIKAQQGAAANP